MIRHLAVVMNGNRRWAKQHGLHFSNGYRNGLEAVKRTIKFCLDRGVSHLSLYTFSLENFKRPEIEQSFLFDVIAFEGEKYIQDYIKQGIRIRFIGDRELFPERVRKVCERLEEMTLQGKKLAVNILFCYGSRQEIVCGVRSLFQKIKSGLITEDQISEKQLEECLWTYGIPEPDLIIRTGGEKRLSNFLLYQAAYSEFYFLDCFWPEVTEVQLQQAVDSFSATKRTYGI